MMRLTAILGLLLPAGVLVWLLGGLGDPHAVDLAKRLAPPSFALPLGADHLGRNLAARILWGAAPSLAAASLVLIAGLSIGVFAGGVIALGPPWARRGVRWLAETALAVPTLGSALVLSSAFGAGVARVALALVITAWAPYALSVAALLERLRAEQYWRASLALGAPLGAAMRRHMLPNIWPVIGALAGADGGRAVILVASLGFIGLSADTGRPEWGAMIHEYRMFLFTEPRLVLPPVVACAVLSICLHMAFDGRGESWGAGRNF